MYACWCGPATAALRFGVPSIIHLAVWLMCALTRPASIKLQASYVSEIPESVYSEQAASRRTGRHTSTHSMPESVYSESGAPSAYGTPSRQFSRASVPESIYSDQGVSRSTRRQTGTMSIPESVPESRHGRSHHPSGSGTIATDITGRSGGQTPGYSTDTDHVEDEVMEEGSYSEQRGGSSGGVYEEDMSGSYDDSRDQGPQRRDTPQQQRSSTGRQPVASPLLMRASREGGAGRTCAVACRMCDASISDARRRV